MLPNLGIVINVRSYKQKRSDVPMDGIEFAKLIKDCHDGRRQAYFKG